MSDYISLVKRISNLAIGRVFKRLHSLIPAQEKMAMEKVFESGSAKEKERFVKKYLPNFEQRYKEELAIVEDEIRQGL